MDLCAALDEDLRENGPCKRGTIQWRLAITALGNVSAFLSSVGVEEGQALEGGDTRCAGSGLIGSAVGM